jgi:hypothetical protein
MITLDVQTDAQSGVQYANKTLIVDMGLGGDGTTFTPPQQEGPFYPLVDFFNASNDLTVPKSFNITFAPVSPPPSSIPDSSPDVTVTNRIESSGTVDYKNESSAESRQIGTVVSSLVGLILISMPW